MTTITTTSAASLTVIGLGPGDACHLSPEALAYITNCDVIVGYSGYVSLVSEALTRGKQIISTGMMGEMARSEAAIDAALSGKKTVVVCSGDPGIYALAGLVLELIEQRKLTPSLFPFTVVPGVPAVCAAAALLGAPLMHDFACISLSDLLTPWETICHRLECAFLGDFVVALYNPQSKRRTSQLATALEIAAKHHTPNTPVGIVKNAYRPGQQVIVTTIEKMQLDVVDMFTIVIIGNSHTRFVGGANANDTTWDGGVRMLTPRGYLDKYKREE